MTIDTTNANESADEALRRRASRRLTSAAVEIERRQVDERRFRPGYSGLLVDLFGSQSKSTAETADQPNAR